MANVKDSPVLVAGSVISVDTITDYDTKAATGAKVLVVAGDGIAVVKFNVEELARTAPTIGSRVAWYIRNAAYSVDSNSGMSTRFVRVVDLGDVDLIHSIIAEPKAQKAA